MVFSKKNSFPVPIPYHIDNEPVRKHALSIFKGFFLAALSGVFFSSTAVLIKYLANLHPAQLTIYRYIGIFAFSFPTYVKCGENILGPKGIRLIVFMISVLGSTQIFLCYLAFRYLPLGEATVIVFSSPAFVSIIACALLKEPCGYLQSAIIVLTMIGVSFTVKLPDIISDTYQTFSMDFIYGISAALSAVLFMTFQAILLRKVANVHHAVIMFNSGIVGIIEMVILTYLFRSFKWHECSIESIYIILLGLFSYLGQECMVLAFQCELAGPVVTVRSAADIVLAFIFQVVLFRNIPDVYGIIGATLVGFSSVLEGVIKWVENLSDESAKKKYVKWIIR